MKIAFIYMASGFGRRFGENKLLFDFEGKPLYLHTLLRLLQVKTEIEKLEFGHINIQILVVSQYEQIREEAARLGSNVIENTKSEEGITASLRLGTKYAKEDTDIFVYFVADQPYLQKDTIKRFLLEFMKSEKGIGTVCAQGKRGNPVAFQKKYKSQLLELRGDRGGSVIVRQNLDDVWKFEIDGRELRDIDVKADTGQEKD